MILKYCLIFIVLLHSSFQAQHGQVNEWQSGTDFTINSLKQLQRTSNYPIHLINEILFPRVFSQEPQVLLMIESLDYQNGKDVDISVSLGKVCIHGFEIRYKLGGPAAVHKLKIKWIAIVDHNVQIQYKELGFMDLKQLRQGEGERKDEFTVGFPKKHFSIPRVAVFITGFKINPDGGSYCLIVEPDDISHHDLTIRASSRYLSKVRYLTVAILSTTDGTFILEKGGIDENSLSYFEINNVEDGIGRQSYELEVPEAFFFKPQNNIIATGISGFDVSLIEDEEVDLMIEHQYLKDNKFHMSFGSNQDSKVFELDFFLILHLPALPDEINEERIKQQNQVMRQHLKHALKKHHQLQAKVNRHDKKHQVT